MIHRPEQGRHQLTSAQQLTTGHIRRLARLDYTGLETPTGLARPTPRMREHTRWGFEAGSAACLSWISRMPMAPAYFGRRELGPFGIRAHKALSPSALKRTSMQRSARKPGGVLAPTCSVPRALVQLVTPYQRLWQERSATTLRIDTNAGKEGGHAPVVVACSILSQLISQRQDEMYRTAKDLRSSMVSRVPSAH